MNLEGITEWPLALARLAMKEGRAFSPSREATRVEEVRSVRLTSSLYQWRGGGGGGGGRLFYGGRGNALTSSRAIWAHDAAKNPTDRLGWVPVRPPARRAAAACPPAQCYAAASAVVAATLLLATTAAATAPFFARLLPPSLRSTPLRSLLYIFTWGRKHGMDPSYVKKYACRYAAQ